MVPRANALGLLRKDDHILLEEQKGVHSKGIGYFYRPIGGTIELGERSYETLIREYKEELNVEIAIKRYIHCLENIYEINGRIGHEITQIYEVEFKDELLYKKDTFQVVEGSRITQAKWISLGDIESLILYPNGLQELIKQIM